MFREPEVYAVDTASVGVVLGTMAGWLPNIAAVLSIIWMLVRLYETPTVQALLTRWRNRKGDSK